MRGAGGRGDQAKQQQGADRLRGLCADDPDQHEEPDAQHAHRHAARGGDGLVKAREQQRARADHDECGGADRDGGDEAGLAGRQAEDRAEQVADVGDPVAG